jgi:hypothetical protein
MLQTTDPHHTQRDDRELSENQRDKTRPPDFGRAMNSMLDNLENFVVFYEKTSLEMLERIEELESSENSSKDEAASEEKEDNAEEMEQPMNDTTVSVETTDSQANTFVSIKRQISYPKRRFIFGLVTLVVGFIAANFALFHWFERIGLHYLLGGYARYVCLFGGFVAMIFGAMLVDNFLVLSTVLRGKCATDQGITMFCDTEE